jgi:glycosyltransferase involved in cell wall biosynthesis
MNHHHDNFVSVIMPTYNYGAFISRSISSVLLQSHKNWELIILDDGSTDYTFEVVTEYLNDPRIKYTQLPSNVGLGRALNEGLQKATHDLIAYLPADDLYYKRHLETLINSLHSHEGCEFVYSGITVKHSDATAEYCAESFLSQENGIQLAQVLHRKSSEKWVERDELVTDDLHVMYWKKIRNDCNSTCTNEITCEWVQHPRQRHRIIRETAAGGIFAYRRYYKVSGPLRFKSSVGSYIDEWSLYEPFRKPQHRKDRLKILLVGELSFNIERLCALEEAGHQLYGLWIDRPAFYNGVGPLAFGNVKDVPLENWRQSIQEIQPDIIYALLNYPAIPLAHMVLTAGTGIPFVWHFKEGPFLARERGYWEQLVELFVLSDGHIFINEEIKEWVAQFISIEAPSLIMDGEMPAKEHVANQKLSPLSEQDGEIHTVVCGRPFGIKPDDLIHFKRDKVHLHLYGEYYQSFWSDWIAKASINAGRFLHIHPQCHPPDWKHEMPKYDAGWLHVFTSANFGEHVRVTWAEMNYPAKLHTMLASGVPVIQMNNVNHIAATQSFAKRFDIGLFVDKMESVGTVFEDRQRLQQVRQNAWKHRYEAVFDTHVERLTKFFYEVIERYRSSQR